MRCVYLNDDYVKAEDAQVSVFDRGFLFGDGVFTTVKVEDGKMIHWEAHLDRLVSQCQSLNIIHPELSEHALRKLIEKNQASSGLWKLKVVITGGSSPELSLPVRQYGTLLAMVEPYQEPTGWARLCKYPLPIEIPNASIKSISYLHRLMVKQYALNQGFDDAVVCSSEGWILETAFSNLFWRERNEVWTPKITLPLLPGTFISSLPNRVEVEITYENLREKREVYMCNALSVRPCQVM